MHRWCTLVIQSTFGKDIENLLLVQYTKRDDTVASLCKNLYQTNTLFSGARYMASPSLIPKAS